MTPLIFANENKSLTIKEILGKDEDRRKLIEKGFCVGVNISVAKVDNKFVVKINNTKYVISFGLANKIMIEE